MLMPTYAWNPYLRLLGEAVQGQGLDVTIVSQWPDRYPILGAWLANGRPDVVHLHWIHDFLGGSKGAPTSRNVRWFDWQLRVLRLRGVRIVWTAHNLKAHEAGEDARDAEAHRRLIERCDAVILHCDYARDALVELYSPSPEARARLHVIPHGGYTGHYPCDLDPDECRRTLGLPVSGPVFAFVGAIRGYKNVAELLDAFMRLTTAGPDARLLVCGKPIPRRLGRELEGIAAADPRIVLKLDRIPEEELSVILRAADVAVLPFRNILTSGSAILALSHGRPVIAPAMGCLPETLPPEAAILYDPDAPNALRDAMRTALSRDLGAMGRAARELAEGLEWGPIGARTAELYLGKG
jgi:beta-1,4-mannosyltransferase